MDIIAIITAILTLVAGIGVFLIACTTMSSNLESASSKRLKRLFAKTGDNKWLGVAIGTVGTAAIQSSGAVTVMVIGFVNVGIMSLAQAATIIYGANIGTTVTAQLVALGMFGGNSIDFCCAFITGSISYTLSRFLEKYEINFFIRGFCCCAFAAFCSLLAAASISGVSYAPVISGCIMLFVPGIPITNSIRDFLSGNMLSGVARLTEACIISVSLAAGAGVVIKVWYMLGGITL